MKKQYLIIGVLIIAAIAGYFYFSKKPAGKVNGGNTDLILYYGSTCPHCKNVEDFIANNKIDEKIKIIRKEVFENKANNAELGEKAVDCGLAIDKVGVPFLWDNGRCFEGDQPIIDYLSKK
ncbi:MAG: hypothetical protein WC715_03085 [Patescibacteria group bacterium]|jgi:glutaredoxin